MKIDHKKLRILFVDDEASPPLVSSLKRQGYDVTHVTDIDDLDATCDGKYQMVFFDIQGVGKVFDSGSRTGTGLDLVEYVASHNPLIFTVVYSAQPWDSAHVKVAHDYAHRTLVKDPSLTEVIEIIETFANSINTKMLVDQFGKAVPLSAIRRFLLSRGIGLTEEKLKGIAKKSGVGADTMKLAANLSSIVGVLLTLAAAA